MDPCSNACRPRMTLARAFPRATRPSGHMSGTAIRQKSPPWQPHQSNSSTVSPHAMPPKLCLRCRSSHHPASRAATFRWRSAPPHLASPPLAVADPTREGRIRPWGRQICAPALPPTPWPAGRTAPLCCPGEGAEDRRSPAAAVPGSRAGAGL
jgi:hypothetical protein